MTGDIAPVRCREVLRTVFILSVLDERRYPMRSFPSTDLKQTLGDVLNAANRGPVTITRYNKPRYVLMSVEDYEQRVRKNERRVLVTSDMPAEHLVMVEAALTSPLSGGGDWSFQRRLQQEGSCRIRRRRQGPQGSANRLTAII